MVIPCGASASSPQAERLSQELSELLPRDARWGVTVLDMKSGREIVSFGNTTTKRGQPSTQLKGVSPRHRTIA